MHKKSREVVKGADADLTIVIRTGDGDALDLTGASQVTVLFRKADKTALSKTLGANSVSIVSAVRGRIVVTLNETETGGLYVMRNAPIEVVVDFGATRKIAQIKAGLDVVDRLF